MTASRKAMEAEAQPPSTRWPERRAQPDLIGQKGGQIHLPFGKIAQNVADDHGLNIFRG